MVNFDVLIHDKKYFELDYINKRQARYNFTQAVKVETFLWDLELYAQLQSRLDEKVILKAAMEDLFKRELSVRSEKISMKTALEQMTDLLERYSNLDSHKSDRRARTAIQNFRGNYEPRSFKDPVSWEIVSKRLQFLVKCISAGVENPLSLLNTVDRLETLMRLEEERYKKTRTQLQKKLRNQFVSDLQSAGFSEKAKWLRNSRPERVLWEVVTPANVNEFSSKISLIRGE